MKPKQAEAEQERLAKVKFRKLARRIPNNGVLMNILTQMEAPLRYDFYHKVKPYLRFEPVPLESIP